MNKVRFIIKQLKYIVTGEIYGRKCSEYFSKRFMILNLLSGNRLAEAIHNIDVAATRANKMYVLQKHPQLDYSMSQKRFLCRSTEELNKLEGERLHDVLCAIEKARKI